MQLFYVYAWLTLWPMLPASSNDVNVFCPLFSNPQVVVAAPIIVWRLIHRDGDRWMPILTQTLASTMFWIPILDFGR